MQEATSHSPEQTITKELYEYSTSVNTDTEFTAVAEANDYEDHPSHPNYERLINRSFYGFWQV